LPASFSQRSKALLHRLDPDAAGGDFSKLAAGGEAIFCRRKAKHLSQRVSGRHRAALDDIATDFAERRAQWSWEANGGTEPLLAKRWKTVSRFASTL
jgi:hypothetical protein